MIYNLILLHTFPKLDNSIIETGKELLNIKDVLKWQVSNSQWVLEKYTYV